MTRTIAYSASGNTASDDDGLGTVTTQIYDSTDRLIEVKNGAATVAAYVHNSDGQRVAKTVGAAVTHYVYANGALVAEADGATGATNAEYVSLGGMPLAFIQGGAVYFIHADHLATPQRITDDTGAIVWDADYRPFGEAAATGALTFNLRFPGQYYDVETELHHNMMRDYDATLGRYVQSDPVGLDGGWNLYAYVSGNPVRNYDIIGSEDISVEVLDPYATWPIHPFSPEHTRRNEKNKCPNSPPEKDCDEDVCKDHTGKEWSRDLKSGEDRYHGGKLGYKTWRHTEDGWRDGWQCTYDGSKPVIAGQYQGTYDYWTLRGWWTYVQHARYDVFPHHVNQNYVDNLTQLY